MARLHRNCFCMHCVNWVTETGNSNTDVSWEWNQKFPTPRNEELRKEKKMADSYKLVVKNGSWDYKWNSKKNGYAEEKKDSVMEFDSLTEALAEFLYSIQDNDGKKVTLSFVPAKKNKK